MRAFLSLIILNTVGIAGCVYAWRLGYAAPLFAEPFFPYAISALFGAGLLSALWRGWCCQKLTRDTGLWEEHIKLDHLHQLSDLLVGLGLIGTTVGLIVAGAEGADQAHALSVALPAALLGFIGWFWTLVNYTILDIAVRLELNR